MGACSRRTRRTRQRSATTFAKVGDPTCNSPLPISPRPPSRVGSRSVPLTQPAVDDAQTPPRRVFGSTPAGHSCPLTIMSNADEVLSGFSSPFGASRARTTARARDFRGPTGPARPPPAERRTTAPGPTSPRSPSRLGAWIFNYGGGSPRSQPTNGQRRRDAPTPAQRAAPPGAPRSQLGSPGDRGPNPPISTLSANNQPAPAPRAVAPAAATSPLRPRFPVARPINELPAGTSSPRAGVTRSPATGPGSGRQPRPTAPPPRDATPPDGGPTSPWKAPFPQ